MKGGNISFKKNKWINNNIDGTINYRYSEKEIEALNLLNVGVMETTSTNSYNIDKKIWFLKSNPSKKLSLYEVIQYYAKENKIELLKQVHSLFLEAYNLRERAGTVHESRLSLEEASRDGHIFYRNAISNLLKNIREVIEDREEFNSLSEKMSRKRKFILNSSENEKFRRIGGKKRENTKKKKSKKTRKIRRRKTRKRKIIK